MTSLEGNSLLATNSPRSGMLGKVIYIEEQCSLYSDGPPLGEGPNDKSKGPRLWGLGYWYLG